MKRERKAITVEEFLEKIPYKAVHVGDKLSDPVRFVEFRKKKTFTASMEFGTDVREFKKVRRTGQDFYFEIIDWKNYVDGTVLSTNDARRKFVLHTILNEESVDAVASAVTGALKTLYKKGDPEWSQEKTR